MAKASFYINDFKVRRKGEFLVVEAQKKCGHGTVFDEVFLTMPGELAHLFNAIDQTGEKEQDISLFERFKRFSSDN